MQPSKGIRRLLTTLVCTCLATVSGLGKASEQTYEFESWRDLLTYFEEIGYTEDE